MGRAFEIDILPSCLSAHRATHHQSDYLCLLLPFRSVSQLESQRETALRLTEKVEFPIRRQFHLPARMILPERKGLLPSVRFPSQSGGNRIMQRLQQFEGTLEGRIGLQRAFIRYCMPCKQPNYPAGHAVRGIRG
jgi:hypothetical protein